MPADRCIGTIVLPLAQGIWRAEGRSGPSPVERCSLVIETEQIVDAVREALHKQAKLTDEMDVEPYDREMRIYLPTNVVPMVSVHSISYQQRSGWFSAVLTAGDRQYSAAGGAHKLVQVPTMAQRQYADDIIGARDLVWKTMRVNRLDTRTVLIESKLVGMSPRRPIVAGRAVLNTEIQPHTLVKRSKHVTIHLKTKFMRLTAKEKSLQNGGRGDVVRVQNVDSGKTIEARVTGPEQVTVSTTGTLALN